MIVVYLFIWVFPYFNFFGISLFPVFITRYMIYDPFLSLQLYFFVAPSRFLFLLSVSMGNDNSYDLQIECPGG